MKKILLVFGILVLLTPVLFLIYYKNNLVCLPRASVSSFIFGLLPFIFLIIGYYFMNKTHLYIALSILITECIVTPLIMIKRLGWEKFHNDRLLAFFTFEIIEITQTILVLIVLERMMRLKLQTSME